MEKAYDPKLVEPRIYEEWEKSGYFNPDNLPNAEKRKPYTIMIAPPNITGSLHMGHALENTISDILIRYHRMRGFRTLWLPGTDHAGIATQNVVEKELKKQGLTRHDLGREEFIKKIWEWKEKYGGIILDQLKKLGASMDWSRTRFTMDEKYQDAVKAAFEHYRKEGLIYQGERVINWCIKDQTALSDLELEYSEEKSKLWYLKYPLKDGGTNGIPESITVATTRPETMLGDTAIAINPKDERYKNLAGKTAILPIINREIPIIADDAIEMEFGTGAVKVTPAHDLNDAQIAERHGLPFLKVINETGKIINAGEGWDDLKIAAAREKIIEEFKKLGLFEKEEEFSHNIAKCYRCGSTVEPMLSKQWFLNMKPLAAKAIAAIKKGEIEYLPERWKGIALDWLENIRDWCISRQIWWGHRIPIEGSEDTFDTWFSSALWPFATLGWPEKTRDLETYYPTQLITSARDIINLWIARMIFSGLEFMDQAPFGKALIHATILTKDGKRMSKSLGTGIDPLGLIEKYGADATRFGLIYQAMGGQDIHFNEDVLQTGKKFANKLWNITRFALLKLDGAEKTDAFRKLRDADLNDFAQDLSEENNKNIIAKLIAAKDDASKQIENYEFGQAAHLLYDFAWKEFADIYIEQSKSSESDETERTLYISLINILKLLHPFMPFITEELWKNFDEQTLLLITEWPR